MLHNVKKAIVFGYFVYNKTITFDYIHILYVERVLVDMEQEKRVFSVDLAGRKLEVEVGQLAKQANGAALIRYGDTVVLSTATASKEPKM